MSTTHSFVFFALAITVSAAPLVPDASQQAAHIVPFWPWHSTHSELYGLLPVQQAIQLLIDTEQGVSTHSAVPSSPAADILAPYEHAPSVSAAQNANATRIPHSTQPASLHHASQTPLIIGAVFGVILVLFMLWFFVRIFMRRRSLHSNSSSLFGRPGTRATESFQEPHSKENRLSDESWLQSSPQTSLKLETTTHTPSPCPPSSHDFQFRMFAFPRGTNLSSVTAPTDANVTVFGSRTELGSDERGEQTLQHSEVDLSLSGVSSPVCPSRLYPSRFPVPPNSPPPSSLHTSLDSSPISSEEEKPLVVSSPGDDVDSRVPFRFSRLLASSFHDDHTTSFRQKSTTRDTIDMRTIRAHVHRRSRSTTNSLYTRAHLLGRADFRGIARPSTSTYMMRDSEYATMKSGLMRLKHSSSCAHLTSFADEDNVPTHLPDNKRDTMTTITTITTQETMSTSNVSYLLRETSTYAEHLPVLEDVTEREQECLDGFESPSCSDFGERNAKPSLSVSASMAVSLSPSVASSITAAGLEIMRMDADAQERAREKERERERARERERETRKEGQHQRTRDTNKGDKEKEKEKARERGWKPPGSPSGSRTSSSSLSSRSSSPSPVAPVSPSRALLRGDSSASSRITVSSNSTPSLTQTPSSIFRSRSATVSQIGSHACPDSDYSPPSSTRRIAAATIPRVPTPPLLTQRRVRG